MSRCRRGCSPERSGTNTLALTHTTMVSRPDGRRFLMIKEPTVEAAAGGALVLVLKLVRGTHAPRAHPLKCEAGFTCAGCNTLYSRKRTHGFSDLLATGDQRQWQVGNTVPLGLCSVTWCIGRLEQSSSRHQPRVGALRSRACSIPLRFVQATTPSTPRTRWARAPSFVPSASWWG